MSNLIDPAVKLIEEAKEYVDLRIEELKLRTAKGLSVSLGQLLAMILVLLVVLVVLIALAIGLVIVTGKSTGNYAGGAFIVAGIFACIAAALFALRRKIFSDSFVGLILGIFFEDDDKGEEDRS